MKQKDHRALARYLMDCVGERRVCGGVWHRRFFVLGCILPDYIPFTYLHGFRQSRAMRGHNMPYSAKQIRRGIRHLEARGVRTLKDSFRLGILMHYLADSFTYPHNAAFQGSMRDHRLYEKELHAHFKQYLPLTARPILQPLPQGSLGDLFAISHSQYENTAFTYEHDCRQIITTCTEVFRCLCW